MESPRLYQILKEHEKREGSNPLLNSLYILLYNKIFAYVKINYIYFEFHYLSLSRLICYTE